MVDVSRDSKNDSLVSLEFVVGGDGEAGADGASGSLTNSQLLELLNALNISEIANIITYPVSLAFIYLFTLSVRRSNQLPHFKSKSFPHLRSSS